MIIVVVFLLACVVAEKGNIDTRCEISSTVNPIPIQVPCVVATFHADSDFQLFEKLDISAVNTYCDDRLSEDKTADRSPIVVVLRGECSFDLKVQNAEKRSIRGVVIVDSNAIDLTKTPLMSPGSQDPKYRSRTPCVLVGKQMLDIISEFIELSRMNTDIAMHAVYANITFTAPRKTMRFSTSIFF